MKNNKNDSFHNKRNTLADIGFYQRYISGPKSSTVDEINHMVSINEKIYRLKLINNITSRIITHYQDLGLINDNRPKGKGWRLFSFTELVWLKVIIKLRDFGFDLKKIKKVKQFLEIYGAENNPSDYPELDFYILLTQRDPDPVKLLVFDSGEALLGNQLEIDTSLQFQTIQDDYISIDLNKLVSGIIDDKNLKTEYIDHSLTPIEKEIKEAISAKNLKSLFLKVDSGDEFILDKKFIMKSAKELNTIFNSLKYAEATTTKRGNNTVYKITEKKKIKKQ
ncbi:MAG: MerR family transcriptional regulator [Candidatus Izemoplasma sp.]